MVGNTTSHERNGVFIVILLSQGHCVQLGVPVMSHCDRNRVSRQALLLALDHFAFIDPLAPDHIFTDIFDVAVFHVFSFFIISVIVYIPGIVYV